MFSILNDIESLVRLDHVVAALVGILVVVLWKRLLPLLVLLAIGFFAWRFNLQQHLEHVPPLALLIGATVLGLATLQAAVVLIFGPQAANGAVGYLVATLVTFVARAPFVLAGRCLRGTWRLLRGTRGQVARRTSN